MNTTTEPNMQMRGVKVSDLPAARNSIAPICALIDSILTWQDLSDARRGALTDAVNHLEMAGQAIARAEGGAQ